MSASHQTTSAVDTDLLASCAAYHEVHRRYVGPFVSDEETERLAQVRDEALARVITLPVLAAEGLLAKAAVALSAMMLDVDDRLDGQPWRERATPEQTIVIDVLSGLLLDKAYR